jgi:peroxiredoxin
MKNRGFFIISAFVILISAGWIWLSRVDPATASTQVPAIHAGFPTPDFSLTDSTGGAMTLSDFKGKTVIINLWASWCRPCRAEMPALQKVYQEYSEDGLVVLGINATNQDTQKDAMALVEDLELTFPVLFDSDGSVSSLYRLRALPTTIFIDPDGIIDEIIVGGPMSEALLRVRVETLMKQNGGNP